MIKNCNLIYSFLRDRPFYKRYWKDEAFGIAAVGYCKAANRHMGSNKDDFSAYAYESMENEFRNEYKRRKRAKSIPENKLFYYQAYAVDSDAYNLNELGTYPEEIEERAIRNITYEAIWFRLGKKERRILFLLSQGYTQSQISKFTGISQSQISRVKKRVQSIVAGEL